MSLVNATRVVRDTPLTFSDGLTLPPGTRFGFAAEQSQRDPDFITDPETFDGFRFVKLIAADARQEDGVGRWAASHASFSNLTYVFLFHLILFSFNSSVPAFHSFACGRSYEIGEH